MLICGSEKAVEQARAMGHAEAKVHRQPIARNRPSQFAAEFTTRALDREVLSNRR